ncbi:MAG: cyclic nucleotide-binding domain-containing protein, partial [Proteobacteria bacterium]
MKPNGYALSDTGLKRSENEDFYLMDDELNLFVVCDGVGGHAAGGLASELCARTLRQTVQEGKSYIQRYHADRSLTNRAIIAGLIQRAVITANEKIQEMADVDVTKRGMCTTVVCLLQLDDFAVLGHVGDSRIYLSRGGKLHQLTEDHKYAVEMVKRGILKPEEASRSPQGNVLTRAVGLSPTIQVDTLQIETMPGDMFMLCTDGLYKYTDRAEMLALLSHEVHQIPSQSIKYARDRGGSDNITALVVKMEGEQKRAQNDVIDVLKKTEIIMKIPVFKYLSYQEVTKVLSIAQVKRFIRGAIMVKEGDPSDEMYIIADGTADVMKKDVKIVSRKKGDVFGEMGIFDRAPRSATVVASSVVVAITLGSKELLALLRQESQ